MDNWRTSSYSSGDGGQCVEVASSDEIMIRDTSDRHGPVLTFAADAWHAFMAGVRQQ
jgi:predicted secreted Zn-dependent protease